MRALPQPVKCPVCQCIRGTHRGKITKHIDTKGMAQWKVVVPCPGSGMIVNDKIVRVKLN